MNLMDALLSSTYMAACLCWARVRIAHCHRRKALSCLSWRIPPVRSYLPDSTLFYTGAKVQEYARCTGT